MGGFRETQGQHHLLHLFPGRALTFRFLPETVRLLLAAAAAKEESQIIANRKVLRILSQGLAKAGFGFLPLAGQIIRETEIIIQRLI
jgi:hypothetical protein